MSAPPMPFIPGAAPKSNWFGRNWRWFVPVVAAAIILLIASLIAGVFALVMGSMKSIEPYRHAVTVVNDDPRALAALGTPIKPKWFISGSFNVNESSGNASLAIPVQGNARKGTVYVEATKSAGEWEYDRLELEIDGQTERIGFLGKKDGKSGKF